MAPPRKNPNVPERYKSESMKLNLKLKAIPFTVKDTDGDKEKGMAIADSIDLFFPLKIKNPIAQEMLVPTLKRK